MAQEKALWTDEIHCTRAPPNYLKTMDGWLVRITPLGAPARITSLGAPAEKKSIIVGKEEVKAMAAVIVTLVVTLVLVIALGVPANLKGVGKARGVSRDRNFVNPDPLPNRLINRLRDLDPQFPRAYV